MMPVRSRSNALTPSRTSSGSASYERLATNRVSSRVALISLDLHAGSPDHLGPHRGLCAHHFPRLVRRHAVAFRAAGEHALLRFGHEHDPGAVLVQAVDDLARRPGR